MLKNSQARKINLKIRVNYHNKMETVSVEKIINEEQRKEKPRERIEREIRDIEEAIENAETAIEKRDDVEAIYFIEKADRGLAEKEGVYINKIRIKQLNPVKIKAHMLGIKTNIDNAKRIIEKNSRPEIIAEAKVSIYKAEEYIRVLHGVGYLKNEDLDSAEKILEELKTRISYGKGQTRR